MDMKIRSAKLRVQYLFTISVTIFRRNGVKWFLGSIQQEALNHVLSAVKPKKLHGSLESDLERNWTLRDKSFFKGFMKHAVKISEAFEIVYSGFGAEEANNGNSSSTINKFPGNGNTSGEKNHSGNTKRSTKNWNNNPSSNTTGISSDKSS